LGKFLLLGFQPGLLHLILGPDLVQFIFLSRDRRLLSLEPLDQHPDEGLIIDGFHCPGFGMVA